MKINLASVFVDDQDKALSFYTQTLGFVKKTEVPVGEFKWLTVRAEGGFGLSMTCASHVQRIGQGFPGQLWVLGDEHREGSQSDGLGSNTHYIPLPPRLRGCDPGASGLESLDGRNRASIVNRKMASQGTSPAWSPRLR